MAEIIFKSWDEIEEYLRTKAPKTKGVCDSCGICLVHKEDKHESICEWANNYVASLKGILGIFNA